MIILKRFCNWLQGSTELQRQKIITKTALLAYELTRDKLADKEKEIEEIEVNYKLAMNELAKRNQR